MNNFSDKEGFSDPILRCDSCNKTVMVTKVHKFGFCNHCGNKRFRQVINLSEEEMKNLKELNVSQDFLNNFKEVDDES